VSIIQWIWSFMIIILMLAVMFGVIKAVIAGKNMAAMVTLVIGLVVVALCYTPETFKKTSDALIKKIQEQPASYQVPVNSNQVPKVTPHI